MALESDGGAGRKRWREDEEGGQGEAAEEEAKANLLSGLPHDLWLRILTLLPLKFAIRTSALSRGWRDLWKRRWGAPSSLSYEFKPRDSKSPREVLDKVWLMKRQRRRLDRFSLTLKTSRMRSWQVTQCLSEVTACGVGDLRIDLRNKSVSSGFVFHFPKSSPLLAHLSLRRVRISDQYYDKSVRPFDALEAIHLDSVVFGKDSTLSKMVALCPRLRVLDLRRCGGVGSITIGQREGRNLRSLTVAECRGDIRLDGVATASSLTDAERRGVTWLDAAAASNLRLFRYSGEFLSSFFLPGNASLSDLYICFGAPKTDQVFDRWFNNDLPNLSNLTVLTFCSNALQIVPCLSKHGANAELAKLSNLQRLRELQLLMFEMKGVNLDHIYVFLKNRRCPNLERLFVQLPAISDEPYIEDFFDEVKELPPEDGLENLALIKVMNFSWNRIEVQLVSFLLRRASSLQTLLVVSPKGGTLDRPCFGVEELLILERASMNAQIILTESDDAATKPFHAEILAEL